MKIYYLQSSYTAGKHRIVQALYDNATYSFDTSVLSPFSTLQIDETLPTNYNLCLDISKTVNKIDINNEGKYYINDLGGLMQVSNWKEYNPLDIIKK